MPDNIYNFLQWVMKKTIHIQDNVVFYKGIHYFIDRRVKDTNAGANDLWNVYVKETIG